MNPSTSSDEQVEQIVSAFTAIVAEVGYRAASLDCVMRRAGLARTDFDRHFSSKEECFLVAWDRANAEYARRAALAFAGGSTWRASIGAVAQSILDFIQECPEQSRLQFEARNAGEAARMRLEAQIDVFVELIDLGRQELDDPDSLSRATAEGIAGAVFERVALRLSRDADQDLSALVPELMFMVLQPYLGTEEAMTELQQGVDRQANG
jgi:AcrR family transcriptional regulator